MSQAHGSGIKLHNTTWKKNRVLLFTAAWKTKAKTTTTKNRRKKVLQNTKGSAKSVFQSGIAGNGSDLNNAIHALQQ